MGHANVHALGTRRACYVVDGVGWGGVGWGMLTFMHLAHAGHATLWMGWGGVGHVNVHALGTRRACYVVDGVGWGTQKTDRCWQSLKKNCRSWLPSQIGEGKVQQDAPGYSKFSVAIQCNTCGDDPWEL